MSDNANVEQPTADSKDARTWGMLCHLAALVFIVGIPFGNILGPLVVWLIKKQEYPLVDREGKKALNFQISMAIYAIVPLLLIIVLIGIPLLILLGLADLILVIMASVKTSNGEDYNYPLSIKFFK